MKPPNQNDESAESAPTHYDPQLKLRLLRKDLAAKHRKEVLAILKTTPIDYIQLNRMVRPFFLDVFHRGLFASLREFWVALAPHRKHLPLLSSPQILFVSWRSEPPRALGELIALPQEVREALQVLRDAKDAINASVKGGQAVMQDEIQAQRARAAAFGKKYSELFEKYGGEKSWADFKIVKAVATEEARFQADVAHTAVAEVAEAAFLFSPRTGKADAGLDEFLKFLNDFNLLPPENISALGKFSFMLMDGTIDDPTG